MKEKMDKFLNFHCPRYDELPSIDLYLDQVISILSDTLDDLYPEDEDKVITGTMINNYVKCRAIEPPNKKKYTRDHLCYLFAICIFKRVFSIMEIKRMFEMQKNTYPSDVAYDYLCTELENALRACFSGDGEAMPFIASKRTQETDMVRSMVLAISNKVYVQTLIEE